MPPSTPLRPPSVGRLLAAVYARTDARTADASRDRATVVAAARDVIADERAHLATNGRTAPRTVEDLAEVVVARLMSADEAWTEGLVSVINATGVIVHTNLGRAPWPREAIEAAQLAASAPLLLELDRDTGRRGHRYRAAEEALIALTGAGDALVTNNNAAAVALAVGLAGRGGGVAVSRGELIEIGGGVRIPEIVRRAGARLIEVGTTNRTRASDFEAAVVEGRAKVILRVHRSNFRLEGFAEDPEPPAVAALAHGHGAIVVDDLGSGALLDTARFGLAHEPMPGERLAAGADVVTFSGDKLVGGPQAGLIVGRADLVARLRKDPLARAMRPDKITLAALAATLGLYRSGRAAAAIPVWRHIAAPVTHLERRAQVLAERLGARVVAVESTIGGGSLPGETLPSFGVSLKGSADRMLAALRRGSPCVVGRIADGSVVLDLRTVEPEQDENLGIAVERASEAIGRAR